MSLYETLEVSPNASPEVIRAAYKNLMQRHHPDKNQGNSSAAKKAQKIADAFKVLSDPLARERYDAAFAHHQTHNPSRPEEPQTSVKAVHPEKHLVKSGQRESQAKKAPISAIWAVVFFVFVILGAGIWMDYVVKQDAARHVAFERALQLSNESRVEKEIKEALNKKAQEEAAFAENLSRRTIAFSRDYMPVVIQDRRVYPPIVEATLRVCGGLIKTDSPIGC